MDDKYISFSIAIENEKSSGSHYIDGKLLSSDASKIQIKSCQFESKMENAINQDLIGCLMNDKMKIPLSKSLFGHFIEKYALFFAFFVFETVFIWFKLRFEIKDNNGEVWTESFEQI